MDREDPIVVSDDEADAPRRPRRAQVVYSRWYHEAPRRGRRPAGSQPLTLRERSYIAYMLAVFELIDPAMENLRENIQHFRNGTTGSIRIPSLRVIAGLLGRDRYTHTNLPRPEIRGPQAEAGVVRMS